MSFDSISLWAALAVLLIIDAGMLLHAAWHVLQRIVSGRRELSWALFMQAVWAFCYGMILLAPSLEVKHFWLKIQNVGIVNQPIFWMLFALNYVYPNRPVNRLLLVSLWIIPAITFALLFRPEWFHLYYAATRLATEHGGPLIVTRGVWYFPQLTQTYLLIIVSAGILGQWFIKERSNYEKPMALLVIAVLAPWLVNLFFQIALIFNPAFVSPIDLMVVAFTLSALMIVLIVYRSLLFDVRPIARGLVMEHIPEMVVTVDALDRVLDANAVAQRWLGKNEKDIVGKDPLDVFRGWQQLINRFLLNHETCEEIQVGDPPRTLELTVKPIYDKKGKLQGRAIVAHDVTDRKKLENDLRAQLEMNESLRAQLEDQAIRDPLTRAFNRRFFSETLDQEVSRAAREGSTVSIIILDLDFFKKFNDTHGHKCGDVVLQTLADFLFTNTRSGDIVCRYGGEEFVILMPNTSVEHASERAETLCASYASLAIEYGEHTLHSTFSAGVAGYPEHGAEGETILHAADQALYQSKRDGRNRVTIFQKEK